MSKSKKEFSLISPHFWPSWLAIGLLWSLTRFPYRWQIRFGKTLGRLLYLFPTKLRAIAEVNIKRCFPELSAAEQVELIKKNFDSLGIGLIESAMSWWVSDEKLADMYKLNGLEHAEAAFAKGKGILLLGPHFTSLEIVGRIISMKYSFAVMYRPHKNRLVSLIHEKFRKKHYSHHIPRHRMRDLLRALNENAAIWYAYDVDAGPKSSVFAPFFGIQTASLTSVSRIVRLSDTTVLPISFYRRENELGYEINLYPPLENFPGENLQEDAVRLNAALEFSIRQKPEQYVWQYKRFKTRPEGEARFY